MSQNDVPVASTPSAVITVGPLSANQPGTAKYAGEKDTQNADYIINNRYESDKHIYMAGITSPGGFSGNSVSFFRLSSPTLLWICDWTAASWNKPPLSPDPNVNDPNWVLMDIMPETSNISVP